MMDSYLVVLGGNELACQSLERLRGHGFKLVVFDRAPSAPGKEIADIFMAVDFSDREAVLKALSGLSVSGIMAINDYGVRTAAYVSQQLGLPGFSLNAAENVCNKVAMKSAWLKAGLKTPQFVWANVDSIRAGSFPQWENFPCIMKPAFSGGGSRGVHVVSSFEEAQEKLALFQSCFIDDEILFEEFVTGATEHTVEVLICEGQTRLMSISDKHNFPGSASIVQTLFFPGPRGNIYRSELETLLDDACRALGLENGCAHFEVLIKGDEIHLLEVGGRPGGGPNFHPIGMLSTGYDYPLELARILTGEPSLASPGEDVWHLGWYYFEIPSGRLLECSGFSELSSHPNVIDSKLTVGIGDEVRPLDDDLCRPAYFMVRGKSHEEVCSCIEELRTTVAFKVAE